MFGWSLYLVGLVGAFWWAVAFFVRLLKTEPVMPTPGIARQRLALSDSIPARSFRDRRLTRSERASWQAIMNGWDVPD